MDSIKNIKLPFHKMFQMIGKITPDDKARIISDELKQICFINNNKLYVLNTSTASYEEVNNINVKILYYALTILDTSFKSLSNIDNMKLFLKNKKVFYKYNTINNNTLSLIKIYITRDNIDSINISKYLEYKDTKIDTKRAKAKAYYRRNQINILKIEKTSKGYKII